jgi:DNA polymerase
LGLEQGKDMKGHRVMLQLSKPRKTLADGTHEWWDDPAKLETLYAYCKQDVEVERACHQRMRELSADEQRVYELYQQINARGIPLDLDAIDKAIALVDLERQRLDAAMRKITGNVVAGCTDITQLTAWLRYRGVSIPGVAKADVLDALATDTLPDDCRTALLLRQDAAKSSTAKFKTMRDGASADGRVRGCLQHHGAHTGRVAGRRVQFNNMPRPTLLKKQDHVEDVVAHFDAPDYLDMMYGPPMALLADTIRGMLRAEPGNEFVCCDFANIEGRTLAWLAGEDWKLQAFRDFDAGTGPDLYLLSYAKAFGCTLEEAQRQVGKVMELALGYEGGVGAFQTMARGYGVQVTDARADELKVAWRNAHPAIKRLWKGLLNAAIDAVRDGDTHTFRGIAYVKRGSFLFCKLRSGRILTYPYPQLAPGKFGGDALSYMCVNSVSRRWERHPTYGGDLTNHVTQATARDLQVNAMQQLTAAGFGIVLEVYDEIVVEAPIGALPVDTMSTIMCKLPTWAAGLPVTAEGWAGARYRK